MTCEAITTSGTYPYLDAIACGEIRDVEPCENCGGGVCIRCCINCYQCGARLHEGCDDEHRLATDHQVDFPAERLTEVMDSLGDFGSVEAFAARVMRLVGRASWA